MFKNLTKIGFKFIIPALYVVGALLLYFCLLLIKQFPFLDYCQWQYWLFCLSWPTLGIMFISLPGIVVALLLGHTGTNENMSSLSYLVIISSFIVYFLLGFMIDHILKKEKNNS
jgi:hypothetical protein